MDFTQARKFYTKMAKRRLWVIDQNGEVIEAFLNFEDAKACASRHATKDAPVIIEKRVTIWPRPA